MARREPPRESTLALAGVVPPERIGDAVLIDPADPLVQPLRKGDPTLGWEGDARLALYLHPPTSRWELWRLEWDNVWRRAHAIPAQSKAEPAGLRGPDAVATLILWLVVHDARRGFNAGAAVIDATLAHEARRDKERAEFAEEAANRLRHGLLKDGV